MNYLSDYQIQDIDAGDFCKTPVGSVPSTRKNTNNSALSESNTDSVKVSEVKSGTLR